MLPPKASKRKLGTKRRSAPNATRLSHLPFPPTTELMNFKQLKPLNSFSHVNVGEILSGQISSALRVPLFELKTRSGIPTSINDYVERTLDLNEHLITYKSSIFFVRILGDSLKELGIFPGDLLVVDKTLTPRAERIVVAILNGVMIIKRFKKEKEFIVLYSDKNKAHDIKVVDDDEFAVWGVVTRVIHTLL